MVSRLRTKLAALLAEAGYVVDLGSLQVAGGFYRQHPDHYARWLAFADHDGDRVSLQGADTVTDCVRHGVVVLGRLHHGMRSTHEFEVSADWPREAADG